VDVKNFWITNLRGFYIGLGLDIKSLNGKIDFHLVEGSWLQGGILLTLSPRSNDVIVFNLDTK
jgi:hypothetical protein